MKISTVAGRPSERLLTAHRSQGVASDVLIRGPTDLYTFLAAHRGALWLPRGDIVLSLGALAPSRAREWEARLNDAYHDCGCSAGAAATIGALMSGTAYLLLQPGGIADTSALEVSTVLVGLGLCTAIGKAVGIGLARKRLRRTVISLTGELESSQSGITEQSDPRP